MSADIDCVVIGAGVVGLAIAGPGAARTRGAGGRSHRGHRHRHQLAQLRSHTRRHLLPGRQPESPAVRGKHLLYAYCAERGVPHKRLGKLIVATDTAQAAQLEDIARRARANGVDDLQYISGEEAMRLEPALRCTAALLSPSTGIVDSHALMLSYQGDAENAGAQCVFHTPLESGHVRPEGGFELRFGGADAMRLSCNTLINAAGWALARRIDGVPAASIPASYLCKGSYFTLSGRAPFSRLIYPVPQHAGLGVHLTLDLGGQAKFGPDTEWVDSEDYTLDPARADVFYEAVRSYWPALPDHALAPGYTGIRPKISGPREPAADFMIAGPADHGVPGLVNLFGIESPA